MPQVYVRIFTPEGTPADFPPENLEFFRTDGGSVDGWRLAREDNLPVMYDGSGNRLPTVPTGSVPGDGGTYTDVRVTLHS